LLPRIVTLRQNHPRSLPSIAEQNGVPYHHPTSGNASPQQADGPKKKIRSHAIEQGDRGSAHASVTKGAYADEHSLSEDHSKSLGVLPAELPLSPASRPMQGAGCCIQQGAVLRSARRDARCARKGTDNTLGTPGTQRVGTEGPHTRTNA